MDIKQILESAEELMAPFALTVSYPGDAQRLDVMVDRTNLVAAAQKIKDSHWGYLSAITGLDRPGAANPTDNDKQWARLAVDAEQGSFQAPGVIEVLYHFCSGPAILTLRVNVSYLDPAIPSIHSLFPTAPLYERELMEMLGVDVTDTPYHMRLLLPDDWPDGVFPLRKAFKGFNPDSTLKA